MFAFVMASMLVATSEPLPTPAKSLAGQPTRHCRELGSAASRSQAIIICRTKAQWARTEACIGATRYCAPKKFAMRETAFPLNEDSRVVCRKLKITGSRLQTVSACLPIREWNRMDNDAREEVSELQDNYSKRPRDQ